MEAPRVSGRWASVAVVAFWRSAARPGSRHGARLTSSPCSGLSTGRPRTATCSTSRPQQIWAVALFVVWAVMVVGVVSWRLTRHTARRRSTEPWAAVLGADQHLALCSLVLAGGM